METISTEILRAVQSLNISSGAFQPLSHAENERVNRAVIDHFVDSQNRRFWWEAFFYRAAANVEFENGDGWRHIPLIAEYPDEKIWLVAEGDESELYPVFETTPRIASAVIGECYAFEYYIVAKDLSWLICESHHNVVFALGETVERNLNAIRRLGNHT